MLKTEWIHKILLVRWWECVKPMYTTPYKVAFLPTQTCETNKNKIKKQAGKKNVKEREEDRRRDVKRRRRPLTPSAPCAGHIRDSGNKTHGTLLNESVARLYMARTGQETYSSQRATTIKHGGAAAILTPRPTPEETTVLYGDWPLRWDQHLAASKPRPHLFYLLFCYTVYLKWVQLLLSPSFSLWGI